MVVSSVLLQDMPVEREAAELSLENDASRWTLGVLRGRILPTFLPFITWLRISLRAAPSILLFSTKWKLILCISTVDAQYWQQACLGVSRIGPLS